MLPLIDDGRHWPSRQLKQFACQFAYHRVSNRFNRLLQLEFLPGNKLIDHPGAIDDGRSGFRSAQ
ncbi:MAG: hypothetical protein ACREX1_22605, partial [Advenella sp.]